jgi:hypothetical protein
MGWNTLPPILIAGGHTPSLNAMLPRMPVSVMTFPQSLRLFEYFVCLAISSLITTSLIRLAMVLTMVRFARITYSMIFSLSQARKPVSYFL